MLALLLNLDLHLKWAGFTIILLGVSHAFFGPRFKWKEELARLSLLNRQIFHVHNFFIAVVLVMLGLLCLLGTKALIEPTLLGRCFTGGVTLFWAMRLFFQFFVYSADLWRGQKFETFIHYLFAFAWSYYTAVFGWAFGLQMGA